MVAGAGQDLISLRDVTEKDLGYERWHPHYETHTACWEGIDLIIRHCRSWSPQQSEFKTQHIEVQAALSQPLPITDTGYRSIFINGTEALSNFDNDPVAYVLAYIRDEASKTKWRKKQEADRQMSLF